MKRYQLKIKLLSDLCVSDGGVYNSTLDTDICHDSYGFPYIPARRIKGCLRECGLELSDWGMKFSPDDLFGGKGAFQNQAKVRIGDAVLKNYHELVDEAMKYAGNLIFHPQNVLNHYSYIRTQTGVDYKTGAADPTSLRTMRVANKGLKFVAEVEMEEADAEKYEDALRACCDTFTSMGVGRTRGLGEIRAKLKKANVKKVKSVHEKKVASHATYVPEAVELHYELALDEPMICKSTDGGETRSLDYIDGGKILGLIANEINKSDDLDFIDFMNKGELFCSNAYLAKNGERYLEVPASYYSIKNCSAHFIEKRDPGKDPEKKLKEVQNENKKQKQLNGMSHCYIRTNRIGTNISLQKESVRIEERYHHRRPEDKSIGRAVKDDESGDSHFYVMSNIDAGQKFRGYVRGTSEQIETVYRCLSNLSTVYLGYARSSEYGKIQIRITELKKAQGNNKMTVTDFAVKLESPVLIYNNRAFYSTDSTDLDAEIRQVLGLKELRIKDDYTVHKYVNYTTLGGYNVTWNMRKPMVEAFDKGTILYYHLHSPAEIIVPDCILIGERISEGLGETTFLSIEDLEWKMGDIIKGSDEEMKGGDDVPVVNAQEDSLAKSLCDDLLRDYVKAQAVKDADKFQNEDNTKKEIIRPTVSNMLLLCQKNDSLNKIYIKVIKRYGEKSSDKEKKLQFADKIWDEVKKKCPVSSEENEGDQSGELLTDFMNEYKVEKYWRDPNKYGHDYLEAFLQQLKYKNRETPSKQEEKEDA